MNNSEKHPEAWDFYIKHARNMEGTDEEYLGKYRIPDPSVGMTISFLHADDVTELWSKFIEAWYKDSLNSLSVRGKIQYIVNNF